MRNKDLLLIKQKGADKFFTRNTGSGNKAGWTTSEYLAYDYPSDEINDMLSKVEKDTGIECEIYLFNPSRENNKIMITSNNYFEQIKPIVSKLPDSVKEAHELVTAMKNDGIDNPFNTGDSDIDSMGELLLKKANEILSESSKAEKPKVEPKPKATAKKTPVKKVAKTAKVAKKVAKQKKAAKPTNKQAAKKIAKKTTKKVAKKVAKKAESKPAQVPVVKKIFSKELLIIKAFVTIDGKKLKRSTIVSKHKTVNHAIDNKLISEHITLINDIEARYRKALDTYDNEILDCSIDKEFLKKCKDIISGAKVKVKTEYISGVPAKK